MKFILITLIVIGLLAFILAVILYLVAQKFKVEENPLVSNIIDVLPGANCGGCGFPGCAGFAENCVAKNSLEGAFCPAGGNETMSKIATILGLSIKEQNPKIAVLKCQGAPSVRPKLTNYDGVATCAIANATYGGETGCIYGCLGFGDCVKACSFNGVHIDEKTNLPVFDEAICVACGSCVKICPKNIIEVREKKENNQRIYVACHNQDKGAEAKKSCAVACIACNKCVKNCPSEAITITNNCAYIDTKKCSLCRKCASDCPTGAILEVNFV